MTNMRTAFVHLTVGYVGADGLLFVFGTRLRLGIGPDRRSLRSLLYISVRAFSIANSIRVVKSTTEKVLETVKKIREFIRGDLPTQV